MLRKSEGRCLRLVSATNRQGSPSFHSCSSALCPGTCCRTGRRTGQSRLKLRACAVRSCEPRYRATWSPSTSPAMASDASPCSTATLLMPLRVLPPMPHSKRLCSVPDAAVSDRNSCHRAVRRTRCVVCDVLQLLLRSCDARGLCVHVPQSL